MGVERMGNINALFNEQRIIKEPSKPKLIIEIKLEEKVIVRQIRTDKTHKLKFPVTNIERMKLQSLCKQVQRSLKSKGLEAIQQTQLNTLLLHYGLNKPSILTWDWTELQLVK